MLPVWQSEFALSYAAVGALRALYADTMATFQIPATLLADRLGTAGVLVGGTALAGLGYILAGASHGLAALVIALLPLFTLPLALLLRPASARSVRIPAQCPGNCRRALLSPCPCDGLTIADPIRSDLGITYWPFTRIGE
jgi:hypothetical protein